MRISDWSSDLCSSDLSVVLTARFESSLAVVPDGAPRDIAFFATIATTLILSAAATAIMLTIALATPSLFGGMSPLLELMLVPTSSAYALAQSWESLAAAEGAYRRLSISSEEHTSELQSLMRI